MCLAAIILSDKGGWGLRGLRNPSFAWIIKENALFEQLGVCVPKFGDGVSFPVFVSDTYLMQDFVLRISYAFTFEVENFCNISISNIYFTYFAVARHYLPNHQEVETNI